MKPLHIIDVQDLPMALDGGVSKASEASIAEWLESNNMTEEIPEWVAVADDAAYDFLIDKFAASLKIRRFNDPTLVPLLIFTPEFYDWYLTINVHVMSRKRRLVDDSNSEYSF